MRGSGAWRRWQRVLTCAVRHTSCRVRVAGIRVIGVCALAAVSMEQSPQLPARSPPLAGGHVPPPTMNSNPPPAVGMCSAAGSGREATPSNAANAASTSTHAPAAVPGAGAASAPLPASSGAAPHRPRLRVDVEKSVVKYKVCIKQKQCASPPVPSFAFFSCARSTGGAVLRVATRWRYEAQHLPRTV